LRLGLVTTSYPRSPGDPAGAFVGGMARWLAGQGHRVEVLAAGPGEDRDGDVRIERIDSPLFYDEGAPDRLERDPRSWLAAPRFAAVLAARVAARAAGWDGVISHWLAPSGLAVALACRRPHLAVAHSGDVHLLARRGLADISVTALLRPRTHLVFVAEHLRDRLSAALVSSRLRADLLARSTIAAMGVEAPRRVPRDEARHLLGLPDDRLVVAFLGRLVPIKGLDVLIDASRGRPWIVAVGGDGPARPASLPENVILLGEVRGERKEALFSAADVLALPSLNLASGRGEGAPTVVREALAVGLPVIASDLPGLPQGVTRLPSGNPDVLAAALTSFVGKGLSSPQPTPGHAAGFGWDEVGPIFLHLFQQRCGLMTRSI
jgi:glycosyltransferase involved in cell wall biosynthesis